MRILQSLVLLGALVGAPLPSATAHAAAPAGTCGGERATMVGTDQPDRLVGTPGRDVIVGLEGWDRIDGRGGRDLICGGPGSDTIRGGAGRDVLLGQVDGFIRSEGRIYVGDTLAGGPGDDRVVGGDDRDLDRVSFSRSQHGVRVDLAAGTSTGEGTDSLRGGIGDVTGSRFADVVDGVHDGGRVGTGDGADVVSTAAGWYGIISASGGADRVSASGRGSVYLGGGQDRAVGRESQLFGEGGADVLRLRGRRGGGAYGDVFGVRERAGADLIVGSAGADELDGAGGDDRVRAGDGDDYVRDGSGRDVVLAGRGDDRIQGYAHGDADRYDGGPGRDEMSYLGLGGPGVRLDLRAGTATGAGGDDRVTGFEDATGSAGDDTLVGTDGQNRLDGDSGEDVLRGRGGADTLSISFGAVAMFGGGGDDDLLVRPGGFGGDFDGLSFDGGQGRDLWRLERSFGFSDPVRIDLAAEEITGLGRAPIVAVEDVTDNGGDHTLVGDAGPNRLVGRGGDDDLVGNDGDDALVGGDGDDSGDGGGGTDHCEAETVTGCES